MELPNKSNRRTFTYTVILSIIVKNRIIKCLLLITFVNLTFTSRNITKTKPTTT